MAEHMVRWVDDVATEHESLLLRVEDGYVYIDYPDPDNDGSMVFLTREEAGIVGCESCGDSDTPLDECPKSERPCGHHCNCVWESDVCCWCERVFGEVQP